MNSEIDNDGPNNSNNGPSIKGAIEIDDDFIGLNEVEAKTQRNQSPIEFSKNDNEYPSENIQATVEMDDADLEKVLEDDNDNFGPNAPYNNVAFLQAQDDGPAIKGTIEMDDKDLENLDFSNNPTENEESKFSNLFNNEAIEGELEIDDQNDKHKLNDKAESNLKHKLSETEMPPPLVDEPTVGESDMFNGEEEYHYEPQAAPPIVALDIDKQDRKEEEKEREAESVGGNNNPVINNPMQIPPEASNKENDNRNIDGGDEVNKDLGSLAIESSGGDEPSPPNDENKNDDEKNGEGIKLDELMLG